MKFLLYFLMNRHSELGAIPKNSELSKAFWIGSKKRQKLTKILKANISITINRKKPWGTAHCVYSLKNIKSICNYQLFYGRDSFAAMFQALQKKYTRAD